MIQFPRIKTVATAVILVAACSAVTAFSPPSAARQSGHPVVIAPADAGQTGMDVLEPVEPTSPTAEVRAEKDAVKTVRDWTFTGGGRGKKGSPGG